MTEELNSVEQKDYNNDIEIEGPLAPSTDETLIFKTTDPMGRTVQMKRSTWEQHIVGGDHDRKEFLGQEKLIEQVISDPVLIINDPIEKRERYYDLALLNTIGKIKPIMVIVDHSHETGDVVTSVIKSTLKDTVERGVVYDRSCNKREN